MLRRDFVRAVISVGVAPKVLLAQQAANPAPPAPAPEPWMLGLSQKTPLPQVEAVDGIAETFLQFFTPLQMQTLTRLSDLLVPPIGDKPGALNAQTPMFLDFLIGNSPEARKKTYAGGLDWLNSEAETKHKVPFSQLEPAQADALLKPWLRTWMNDHPPTEQHADFINIAHDDIRTATVHSKVWSDFASASGERAPNVELYWSPIEPDAYSRNIDCAGTPPHVMAAPKSGHPIPSYPR
jgi:hypothetical protein